MERFLEALVQHARVDLSARYPLVFGAEGPEEEEEGATCAGSSRSTRC